MTRTAARVGRLSPSVPVMDVPGSRPTPVAVPAARRRRSRPAAPWRPPARRGADRSRGAGWRRRRGPTHACGDGGNCEPPRCRSASQSRTLPGDIRQKSPREQAQRWRGPARSWRGRVSAAAVRRQRGSELFQPSERARAAQTVRRWRPLSRRDFKMALPARVDMRLRNPWVLARFRVFG
jgi:hypothetical protein